MRNMKGILVKFRDFFLCKCYIISVFIAIMGISLVKTRWRTTWGIQAGGRI